MLIYMTLSKVHLLWIFIIKSQHETRALGLRIYLWKTNSFPLRINNST